MYVGQDLTHDTTLDAKQYELLGLDLGDGISRKMGGLVLLISATWIALLWLIIGHPQPATMSAFIIPPAIMSFYGARKSPQQPRRVNITQWALKVRQLFIGHRPIVNLGRGEVTRGHYMPWRDRVDMKSVIHSFQGQEEGHIVYRTVRPNNFRERPTGRVFQTNKHTVTIYADVPEVQPRKLTLGKKGRTK